MTWLSVSPANGMMGGAALEVCPNHATLEGWRFPSQRAVPMTSTLALLIADQLAQAVDNARHARHHPDCRCANYRPSDSMPGSDGAPYCTALEKRWEDTINRLIEKAVQENRRD